MSKKIEIHIVMPDSFPSETLAELKHVVNAAVDKTVADFLKSKGIFKQSSGECQCPNCVARRKAEAAAAKKKAPIKKSAAKKPVAKAVPVKKKVVKKK